MACVWITKEGYDKLSEEQRKRLYNDYHGGESMDNKYIGGSFEDYLKSKGPEHYERIKRIAKEGLQIQLEIVDLEEQIEEKRAALERLYDSDIDAHERGSVWTDLGFSEEEANRMENSLLSIQKMVEERKNELERLYDKEVER